MMRYRKKPVEVDAMRYDGTIGSLNAVLEFTNGRAAADKDTGNLAIATLEGVMVVLVGDWVIKGVAGEFYPCKPEIFDATYEPVSS